MPPKRSVARTASDDDFIDDSEAPPPKKSKPAATRGNARGRGGARGRGNACGRGGAGASATASRGRILPGTENEAEDDEEGEEDGATLPSGSTSRALVPGAEAAILGSLNQESAHELGLEEEAEQAGGYTRGRPKSRSSAESTHSSGHPRALETNVLLAADNNTTQLSPAAHAQILLLKELVGAVHYLCTNMDSVFRRMAPADESIAPFEPSESFKLFNSIDVEVTRAKRDRRKEAASKGRGRPRGSTSKSATVEAEGSGGSGQVETDADKSAKDSNGPDMHADTSNNE